MIGSLNGKIIDKRNNCLIIEVGGVGYKIYTTREIAGAMPMDKNALLWTHLSVREDSQTLYGFKEKTDLEFFEMLLTVSGIGPKSALTILNIAPVSALRSAIASGDAGHLTKTTGVGLKKAEKIILELKDKFDLVEGELEAHKEISDATDALVALGYSRREASEALKKVPASKDKTEEKIKEALRLLGK